MRRPRATEIATASGAVVAVIAVVVAVVFGTGTSSSDDDGAPAAAANSAVATPATTVSVVPATVDSNEPTPSPAWQQVSTWPMIGPSVADPAAVTAAQANLAAVLQQADITDALHPRLLALGAKCNVAAFEMAENGDLSLLIFATARDAGAPLRWKPSGWITAAAPDYALTLPLGPGAAGATCTVLVRNGGATFDVGSPVIASSPAS